MTLANGMKVLFVPTDSKVATFNVTFTAGSTQERLGKTGYAHYLEHMLFGGSKNYQGINGMWHLEELGATLNATTYYDRTNFYECIQPQYLGQCIEREADRMFAPIFSPEKMKTEYTVVLNEYQQGRNSPFAIMDTRMKQVAFTYGRYRSAVIGHPCDLHAATIEDLQQYHKENYTPNNATCIVTGSFDHEKTLQQIKDHFGPIPSSTSTPRYMEEPPQNGMRRFEECGDAGIVGIGFKAPCGLHEDAIALEVLAHNMNSGSSSILDTLVQRGIVYNVNASWQRVKHPFLFEIWASAPDPYRAEQEIWKLLQQRPQFDVTSTKQALKHKWNAECESSAQVAAAFNEAVARGAYQDVFDRHHVVDQCNVDNAWKYLVPHHATVGIMAPGIAPSIAAPDWNTRYSTPWRTAVPTPLLSVGAAHFAEMPWVPVQAPAVAAVAAPAVAVAPVAWGRNCVVRGANRIHATFEYKLSAPPAVCSLLGALVGKGFSTHDARATTQLMSRRGVKCVPEATPSGVLLHYSGPADTLALMCEEMSTARLDVEQFKLVRTQQQQDLQASTRNVNAVAARLLQQCLFSNVPTLAQEETGLVAPYSSVVDVWKGRSSAVVTAVMSAAVPEPWKSWESWEPVSYKPRVVACKSDQQYIPNKTSCAVKWGCVSKPSAATMLAASVLGSGFAGRLMKQVREKCGLTYGIYAHTTGSTFEVVSSFSPDLLQRGLHESENVIATWRRGISAQEFEIHKRMILAKREVLQDDGDMYCRFLHTNHVTSKELQQCSLEEVNHAIAALPLFSRVQAGTYT
jgi:zinc protease